MTLLSYCRVEEDEEVQKVVLFLYGEVVEGLWDLHKCDGLALCFYFRRKRDSRVW